VNSGSWDYAALHEVVGGVEVGLKPPYHLVLCRDGGLALPPIPELRDERKAVEFFNQCLAAILLGGIYCEAIALDGLEFGSIIDWKHVRIQGRGQSAPNRFHNLIRMQRASSLEAIALLNPRMQKVDEIVRASESGRKILDQIPELGGEFLLRGATGFARRDWGVALANLWIVVEQMTSHLWKRCIVDVAREDPRVPGRIDSLDDNRTWTVGVRHEVLFQRNLLSQSAFEHLNSARKARNRLSHSGKHPDEDAARAALNSVMELFPVLIPDLEIPFLALALEDHGLSDPFEPNDPKILDPQYWMEIRKLPGEQELELLEAKARGDQRT
jgi:hypothetical protein